MVVGTHKIAGANGHQIVHQAPTLEHVFLYPPLVVDASKKKAVYALSAAIATHDHGIKKCHAIGFLERDIDSDVLNSNKNVLFSLKHFVCSNL